MNVVLSFSAWWGEGEAGANGQCREALWVTQENHQTQSCEGETYGQAGWPHRKNECVLGAPARHGPKIKSEKSQWAHFNFSLWECFISFHRSQILFQSWGLFYFEFCLGSTVKLSGLKVTYSRCLQGLAPGSVADQGCRSLGGTIQPCEGGVRCLVWSRVGDRTTYHVSLSLSFSVCRTQRRMRQHSRMSTSLCPEVSLLVVSP